MDPLQLSGKHFLIFGVSNKRSVAWCVAKSLMSLGAEVYLSVRNEQRREEVKSFTKCENTYTCEVENLEEIKALAQLFAEKGIKLDGIVHSIAFANYRDGVPKFYETKREDYLQATQISAFSLVEIAGSFKSSLNPQASVVTVGISSTEVTAENYGYMAAVKASLNAMVRYLAKSFSSDTEVRFNSVDAGPLKTKSSAGIPGYLKNYLYAEQLTYRKRAISVAEVSNTILFLLSPLSSGINAQGIVVNAGMDFNYFDTNIVEKVTDIDG